MPESFGLLGAGAQADEIEEFARPDRAIFRAVTNGFAGSATATIDILITDRELVGTPVVAAVGAPGLRRSLVQAWAGTRYRRVIAPQAWIASDARLGDGVMVSPFAALSVRTVVGDHALLNIGATVSHDTTIGAYATLSPGVHVAGRCTIGDGTFLGIGASVIQGINIASGSVIGAGAAVVSDIDEAGLYLGTPARRVRPLEEWLHVI